MKTDAKLDVSPNGLWITLNGTPWFIPYTDLVKYLSDIEALRQTACQEPARP